LINGYYGGEEGAIWSSAKVGRKKNYERNEKVSSKQGNCSGVLGGQLPTG